MPRSKIIRPLALLSAVVLILSVGCGDEVSIGENQERYNTETPPDDLDDQSRLLHILDDCQNDTGVCSIGAAVGGQRALDLQLVNADGDPIEDARIDFDREVAQGGGESDLAADSIFTDADGVASNTISFADEPDQAQGTVEVTATVAGDDDIEELVFRVGISPKNAASYIIEFDHQGQSEPDHVQPLLMDPNDIDCDEATDDFFDDLQWPTADVQLPTENVHPGGDIDSAVVPGVENNDSFVIVAIGQQEIDAQEIDVAYGCTDDAPAVSQGVDQNVEVVLNDHIPYLAHKPEGQRYDVNHQFDLTDALPGPVQQIIDLIATLADNPGEFIIGGSDGFGLIDDVLLDFLPDSISDQIDTLLDNDAAVAAAQDFLNDAIENFMPDWVNDTTVAVGDITSMLQEFTVTGRIYFNEQPIPAFDGAQAVGLIDEEHTEHYWDTLIFQWSLGCEDSPDPDACAQIPISANDLGSDQSDIIYGEFDATVFGSDSIAIERHSMTLHYGALLIAVIEQVVLPRLINDNVTSLDDLFDELGVCSGLADAVGSPGDNLYDAALNMCQNLQSQATGALYDYVEDALVAEGDDHFRIGTADGEPCSIEQPEYYPTSDWPGNPLPFVDTWGQADGEMGCDWDVEINYSGGSEPDQVIGGEFDATFVD